MFASWTLTVIYSLLFIFQAIDELDDKHSSKTEAKELLSILGKPHLKVDLFFQISEWNN